MKWARHPGERQRRQNRIFLHLGDESSGFVQFVVRWREMERAAVVILEVDEEKRALGVGDGIDEEDESVAEQERELGVEHSLPVVAQRELGVGGDAGREGETEESLDEKGEWVEKGKQKQHQTHDEHEENQHEDVEDDLGVRKRQLRYRHVITDESEWKEVVDGESYVSRSCSRDTADAHQNGDHDDKGRKKRLALRRLNGVLDDLVCVVSVRRAHLVKDRVDGWNGRQQRNKEPEDDREQHRLHRE